LTGGDGGRVCADAKRENKKAALQKKGDVDSAFWREMHTDEHFPNCQNFAFVGKTLFFIGCNPVQL
jgi:hypothetical protein